MIFAVFFEVINPLILILYMKKMSIIGNILIIPTIINNFFQFFYKPIIKFFIVNI
jgi:hypothetical protein